MNCVAPKQIGIIHSFMSGYLNAIHHIFPKGWLNKLGFTFTLWTASVILLYPLLYFVISPWTRLNDASLVEYACIGGLLWGLMFLMMSPFFTGGFGRSQLQGKACQELLTLLRTTEIQEIKDYVAQALSHGRALTIHDFVMVRRLQENLIRAALDERVQQIRHEEQQRLREACLALHAKTRGGSQPQQETAGTAGG